MKESRERAPRYTLVSYPWTRVPKQAPPVDTMQLHLLPVADLFMGLMFSRPGGLSLRTTWVTPASIWLCGATSIGAGVLGVGAIGYGIVTAQILLIALGLLAVPLAFGAATVAVYGIRQRLLLRV